jgi:hypothetical protein
MKHKCNTCLAEINSSERICPYCRSNVPYSKLSYGKDKKGNNLVEAATALLFFGVVMLIIGYLANERWTSYWNLVSVVLIGLGMIRFLTKSS